MEAWTELNDGRFSYEIVSERGSEAIRTKVLRTVLAREQEMVNNGGGERAELTSANYEFTEAGEDTDGTHIVHIKPRRQDVLLGTDLNVAFERPLGEILFVHVVDDVRSFRLETDGLYHRLPEQQLALTLRTEKLATGDKDWVIGWTWNGAWSRVGMIASRVPGEERDVRVTIPSGAQQLWWSSSGIPPDLHGDPGGFQAIAGSSMKVVLR